MTKKEASVFLRYITHSPLLTKEQRNRRDRLLSRDYMHIAKETVPDPEAIYLLEIWEKEGLDAAVSAWKNGDYKKEQAKRKKNKKKTKSPFEGESVRISKGDFENLKKDIDSDPE